MPAKSKPLSVLGRAKTELKTAQAKLGEAESMTRAADAGNSLLASLEHIDRARAQIVKQGVALRRLGHEVPDRVFEPPSGKLEEPLLVQPKPAPERSLGQELDRELELSADLGVEQSA